MIGILLDWEDEFAEAIKHHTDQFCNIRSDGNRIYCRTEESAETIADLIDIMYASQDTGTVHFVKKENSGEFFGWYYIEKETEDY